MDRIDADTLLRMLKASVGRARHGLIDQLYFAYVSNPCEETELRVHSQLVHLCGAETVQNALSTAAAAMLKQDMEDDDDEDDDDEEEEEEEEEEDADAIGTEQNAYGSSSLQIIHGSFDDGDDHTSEGRRSRTNTMDDQPNGSDYEGDDDENDADEKGNLEVCEASLRAWNHCVNCSNEECKFRLCRKVRPYVEHRRKLMHDGVVGMCKESCNFCLFHDNMTRRVKPPEQLMSRSYKKKLAKEKRIIQTFAGLLLAHKQPGGDPAIRQLYDHMMACNDAFCAFRLPAGSCKSSRKLMHHLQECKWTNTKTCALCSKLPPKVKRMKRAPRSLPVPPFVRAEIVEQRKERQKERRRLQNALKRHNQGSPGEGPDYAFPGDAFLASSATPAAQPSPFGSVQASSGPLFSDAPLPQASGHVPAEQQVYFSNQSHPGYSSGAGSAPARLGARAYSSSSSSASPAHSPSSHALPAGRFDPAHFGMLSLADHSRLAHSKRKLDEAQPMDVQAATAKKRRPGDVQAT